MKDSTKKRITNCIWPVTTFYGFLAYLMYYLPWASGTFGPVLTSMGEHFILIPVCIVLGTAGILVPFALVILIFGYYVDMLVSKLLGIEFP